MAAEASPLPREESTPPVTKMNFELVAMMYPAKKSPPKREVMVIS